MCSVACPFFYLAESRCILLPVVLRVLQGHMQEQKDLVMCARILTSMLSLIKKEENSTAVSSPECHPAPCILKGRSEIGAGVGGGEEEKGKRSRLRHEAVINVESCRLKLVVPSERVSAGPAAAEKTLLPLWQQCCELCNIPLSKIKMHMSCLQTS